MTPHEHRLAMVAGLRRAGALDGYWHASFVEVSRHEFLPDVIWTQQEGTDGRLRALSRHDHPTEWLERNAALLAHRTGAENVVSVEIDHAVAAHARVRLDATGFGQVTVVTADGSAGWPERSPFDRVIATAGVVSIPYQWVRQCRAGAMVVAPLRNAFHPPGLAVLRVGTDGVARGSLGRPFTFMGMRDERCPRPTTEWIGSADSVGSTDVHPHHWVSVRGAALTVGLRIGDGVHVVYTPETGSTGVLHLLDPGSNSWAAVHTRAAPPYPTQQAGPRRLIDEVTEAYQWWQNAGSPGVADWTVEVGPGGQRIVLVAPAEVIDSEETQTADGGAPNCDTGGKDRSDEAGSSR